MFAKKDHIIKDLCDSIVDFKNFLCEENRYSVVYEDRYLNKEIDSSIEHKVVESERNLEREDPIPEQKEKIVSFNALSKEAAFCTRCSLSETRSSVVFGYGDVNSPIVIIGEAPGAEEDKQGLPFVGRAGKLLDKMLSAISLTRDNLYICNILKCRPPNNRNPLSSEIDTCSSFLENQLKLIKPRILITLGNFASKYIIGTTEGISKLRGNLYKLKDYEVLPMYHPAALLHNPSLKRDSWEDLKYLRRLIKEAKLDYLFCSDATLD